MLSISSGRLEMSSASAGRSWADHVGDEEPAQEPEPMLMHISSMYSETFDKEKSYRIELLAGS